YTTTNNIIRESDGSGTAGTDGRVKLRAASRLPRVLMMVDEKSLGSIPTAEVESLGAKLLLQQNVPVVDQDMVKANIAKGQQLLKMAGDARGAAALGLQFGADVVIMGEVVAKPSARRIADSNLRTYQAVATLRAVRTDNAATLATASEDASIVALDDIGGSAKALRSAGQKTLEVLIPAMIEGWEKGGGSGGNEAALTRVSVTIGGVDQVWKLKALREMLHGLGTKAQNVVQRNYTAGMVIFDLDSTLSAEEFSEALVLTPPQGLKLQVLNVSAGKVDLRAVAAQ
ncbi:MAG: hypothetical protein NTY53_16505, partial [Kiritimatiellaeota bacterium]|nr:hypothetical protein [Kiritimatiellota bacterium]